MLTKYPLYYHTFGAPMATRNKQVSSVLVKNTLYASSFTSGTDGWVATSNATLSNVYGNIRATVTALNAGMQKTFSTEAGKTYRIRFKVNLRGWPYMYVKDVASTTNLISITDFMTPGDYSYTFTATGFETNVIFHEAGNASGSVQLASFILEEVEAENGYRFGFNGKEKDNETSGEGNSYNYDARIYNSRIGLFLSCDPATQKYPFMTPYSAFGNNPIYFKDNGGRTLEPGGKKDKALYDIQSLVPKEYQSQIVINKAGKIEFLAYDQLPDAVKKYEGVTLVNDLINSKQDYKYSVSDETIATSRVSCETYNLVDETKTTDPQVAIVNLSITERTDHPIEDQANFLPETGFEGSVTIPDGRFFRSNPVTTTGKFEYKRNNVVFHELKENMLRTEGQDYKEAHKNASNSANKFSKETNAESDPYGGYATEFEHGPEK